MRNETVRAALFGSGQDGISGGGLISNAWIGGESHWRKNADGSYALDANGNRIWVTENPYDNIRTVLNGLGIHTGTQQGHHTHFHVDVRRPNPVGITSNLLAESASLDQTQGVGSETLQSAAQTLLAQVQSNLNFDQGDVSMFVMDLPDVPPQYAPVVIAQTTQAQQVPSKIDRTIGVCQLVENPIRVFEEGPLKGQYWATNDIGPAGAAHNYLWNFERRQRDPGYKVSLLKNPEHGTLKPIVDPATGKETDGGWHYIAEDGYLGPDRATFLVEAGGMKIEVEYFIEVLKGIWMDAYEDPELCPKGHYWRINLNPDDPNAPIYTFESPTQITSPYAGLANVNLTFNTLAPGALGQTTGDSITLDPTAAGHGWFVDPTPWDNSEFLPTHNPNEWVAKEGSGAASKMDLLSVLLHEYGHVLGLDHSADQHDFMATTLTPGVRRMPSSEELALMARLVGEVKTELLANTPAPEAPMDAPFPWLPLDSTLGLAFLGRLRNRLSEPMSWDALQAAAKTPGADAPQYAVAANATLLNGTLDAPQGWETQGAVDFANGNAVLREVSNSQSRLSQ